MKAARWSPPRVSRARVAYNNLISSRSGYLYFTAKDVECRLRLLSWRRFSADEFGVELELAAGPHGATLFLTQWPLGRLVGNDIETAAMSAWPMDLRITVAEIELEGLPEVVSTLLHRPINIRAVRTGGQISRRGGPPAADRVEPIWFLLETRTGLSTLGCVVPSQRLYRDLIGRIAQISSGQEEAPYSVHLYPRIELASVQLARQDVNEIGKGDVVVLDRRIEPDHIPVRLALGSGLQIIGVLTGETIMVEGVERVASQDSLSADDIDSINVTVKFDVGTLGMSFGDLKTIRPGHTFVIGRRVDRVVHIHCNGKLIGIGELVQVDDRSGVRVLEIFGFKHG